MPAILNKCSLTQLSDGILSFIQYLFKTPEITPHDFRWNPTETETKIFIAGPFTVSRQKIGQLPSVIVSRTPFQAENRVIDHAQSADENVMTNPVSQDVLDGSLNVICECGASDEAEALASFIFLEIQANRKQIVNNMPFAHRLLCQSISASVPVKEAAEIERWQCSFSISASIYMGWIKTEKDGEPWTKAAIFNTQDYWESNYGTFVAGSDIISDASADFGTANTNKPKLNQQELSQKWYYVLCQDQKLTVEEILDNKRLRLSVVDADGNVVPYQAPASATTPYKLVWNHVRLYTEIKK